MNHLPLIIRREYITKVKNKSFIIMTFLSPLLFIALISVVAYLSQLNNDKVRIISVLDKSGVFQESFQNSEELKYIYLENKTIEEAKEITEASENFGLLYVESISNSSRKDINIHFYSDESASLGVISDLERIIEQRLTYLNLKERGIDSKDIEAATVEISINQENYVGISSSKIEGYLKLIFGGAAGYLLFMFIIIYGNMIMRSVIEEKTSRIIEVIISSVKPIQLMLGKIIGTSLAGITQFTIWLILGSVLMIIVSIIFNIDISATQTPQQMVVSQAMESQGLNMQIQEVYTAFSHLPVVNLVIAFLFFFIGGYLLYSSIYAAIGAAVDNETDTQQFMLPVLIPLILAVYIGIFTVIDNPHGTVSTIFSFIPFTSPVVMLMRIPFGVPIWQQVVSLILLIGMFLGTVWFAAKIYRVGILMYGKKPSYKELIKWIKY
ncbi:ABC transporter permease [Aurantibacter sp.]|uniref:ABC transporter permease n=1 Tax=Aurantibacter sp. TaxID=2807103 RepID=UPI0035C858BB